MLTVLRFSLRELARNRWLGAYALFFGAVGWALFYFGAEPDQAAASVLDLVVFLVPLVSLVVGVLCFYNAREYADLLLTQPVSRRAVFVGQYLAVAVSLAVPFAIGLAAPFLWYGMSEGAGGTLLLLLLAGLMLTLICVALAFLISDGTEDRLKALGGALVLWLFFAVIYDGLLLALIMTFPTYQLGRPLVGLALLNPFDLARIMILLRLDIAALMGYTGAIFQQFFGARRGLVITLTALSLWIVLPILLGARAYTRRDF
ncbi:MAG TPA: ABC transporter permease subunit [Candidatus Acidoferrales bacterium]|nr:ABC transporter permease subunit [Candidatus Acidoferrales bacterium]